MAVHVFLALKNRVEKKEEGEFEEFKYWIGYFCPKNYFPPIPPTFGGDTKLTHEKF